MQILWRGQMYKDMDDYMQTYQHGGHLFTN